MNSIAKHNSVPFNQKVAFGIGMLANQMFPAAMNIFLIVFVEGLGLPVLMWGALMFLPRTLDCITDPLMGFISDNTKSRWGKRRPYIFIGAFIIGISFCIMWQIFREDPIHYTFWYFLLWSFVFYIGLTIFSVPYVALGYEMSEDFHERTSIMAIAQWIGQWAWVIAPWFWVVMYDQGWFESPDAATRELAIWVGLTCMVFAVVPAIFIKSKSTVNADLEEISFGNLGVIFKKMFTQIVQAFSSAPFRKLCFSTFLIFNSFNTVASFSFLIILHYLFNGDESLIGLWPTLFGSVMALGTTFIVIPTVKAMADKMGKQKAFMVTQVISIFGYIILWFLFVPGKPYLFLFALPFISFGIGGLFTLMMSMTPDVIDLDELQRGERREGIFGAVYWFMVKMGFAFTGLLAGLILTFVGFDSELEKQATESVNGLRMAFSIIPIVATLISLWIMKSYDIDEARANEIREELEKKKGAAS
ncbi:MFS transporter [Flagellimonas sp.]|uniref:MFS transporter n=1 Tax=Flagellimonas sp. TaxID=2058762 RepID=UPI003B503B05